jgi:crotonobetainyl-CoA:carnitine CoA-transferase CaiB-like acyl-CoA transferase
VTGILKGIRVLDFTRVVAGPFATRMLADFGAEVIKIQSSRTAGGFESNTEPYFCTWNRNKRSITLDMGHPEARELVLQLTAISDVVVENFSPRVMANWDLAYHRLQMVNTKLIMLSMSGMGQTGPWRDHVAFGPTVQALGGLTYLTGYEPREPMGVGFAYADMVSGLYGAIAVLTALENRDRTDRGQFIDLSEHEAVCTTLGPTLMEAFLNMCELEPAGDMDIHQQAGPYGCYRCQGSDRWCVIAVYSEDEWQALCRVIGDPGLAEDDRFLTAQDRRKFKPALDLVIGGWTQGRSAESVIEHLQEAGVPAGVVQNAADLAGDPQLAANDFFTALDHPVLGRMTTETTPVKLKNSSLGPWKAAPLLGEANDYVFGELLGMRTSKIESYKQKGIIA